MRKKLGAIVTACLAATVIAAIHPATASATVAEGDRAVSVSGALDAWSQVGNVLNIVVGSRSCTVTADGPYRSANQVKGHGSVNCNHTWDLLTLQVCVQVKQAAADDAGLTWQNAGCQPLKQKKDASSLSDTATAQCVPQAASYRTWVEAQGFRDENDSEPTFVATISSGEAVFNCGI